MCHCLSLQHFVSERKYDEDLGKAVKFSFDLEPLKCSIMSFGSGEKVNVTIVAFVSGHELLIVSFCVPTVYHPQTSYSSRSRCSSTSSSVTGSNSVKATPTTEHQPSAYTGRPNVPHKQVMIHRISSCRARRYGIEIYRDTYCLCVLCTALP